MEGEQTQNDQREEWVQEVMAQVLSVQEHEEDSDDYDYIVDTDGGVHLAS